MREHLVGLLMQRWPTATCPDVWAQGMNPTSGIGAGHKVPQIPEVSLCPPGTKRPYRWRLANNGLRGLRVEGVPGIDVPRVSIASSDFAESDETARPRRRGDGRREIGVARRGPRGLRETSRDLGRTSEKSSRPKRIIDAGAASKNIGSFAEPEFKPPASTLTRRNEIFSETKISGEHQVSQSFSKWRRKYCQEHQKKADVEGGSPEVLPPVAREVEVDSGGAERDVTRNKGNMSQIKKDNSYFDTSNGAMCRNYAWNQTVEDVEVKVPVPGHITKGHQVNVKIESRTLKVSMKDLQNQWQPVIEGSFPHMILANESMWSLLPNQCIIIHLEKIEERWWNKLFEKEEGIDLGRINAERDYGSLPEDERAKIQELMWNKQQQEQGKPTSDVLKMQSMLKEAWDVEGSPFKGRPFDPSLLNYAGSLP
ncbi:uncharacterized protein LOC143027971 [Oratosquilla oratoria]|uniref:uncharacterized protein LOC143027971 n=1 Tax=Oratosquilla oratoria TaxID=337810 RepID=UPI003F768BBC